MILEKQLREGTPAEKTEFWNQITSLCEALEPIFNLTLSAQSDNAFLFDLFIRLDEIMAKEYSMGITR